MPGPATTNRTDECHETEHRRSGASGEAHHPRLASTAAAQGADIAAVSRAGGDRAPCGPAVVSPVLPTVADADADRLCVYRAGHRGSGSQRAAVDAARSCGNRSGRSGYPWCYFPRESRIRIVGSGVGVRVGRQWLAASDTRVLVGRRYRRGHCDVGNARRHWRGGLSNARQRKGASLKTYMNTPALRFVRYAPLLAVALLIGRMPLIHAAATSPAAPAAPAAANTPAT